MRTYPICILGSRMVSNGCLKLRCIYAPPDQLVQRCTKAFAVGGRCLYGQHRMFRIEKFQSYSLASRTSSVFTSLHFHEGLSIFELNYILLLWFGVPIIIETLRFADCEAYIGSTQRPTGLVGKIQTDSISNLRVLVKYFYQSTLLESSMIIDPPILTAIVMRRKSCWTDFLISFYNLSAVYSIWHAREGPFLKRSCIFKPQDILLTFTHYPVWIFSYTISNPADVANFLQ